MQLRTRLPGFLAGAKAVLCDMSTARAREQPALLAALQGAKLDDARIRPLRPLMHRLRRVGHFTHIHTCLFRHESVRKGQLVTVVHG